MYSKIKNAYQLIQNGHSDVFLNEIKKRFYSSSVSIGLQRDLNVDFQAPSSKIKIHVRPLIGEDVPEILSEKTNVGINPRIISNQLSLVNLNIPTCYVAATINNKPCYMQWLIGYNNNHLIKKHFKGVFPPLKKSEALLEAAFSNPAYRGLQIMPRAMSLIAEKASEINARWVNTYVDVTNIPSLKGCQRSGFKPFLLRKDRWFFFHRSITFHPITESMNEIFYQITESNASKKTEMDKSPAVMKTSNVDKYS